MEQPPLLRPTGWATLPDLCLDRLFDTLLLIDLLRGISRICKRWSEFRSRALARRTLLNIRIVRLAFEPFQEDAQMCLSRFGNDNIERNLLQFTTLDEAMYEGIYFMSQTKMVNLSIFFYYSEDHYAYSTLDDLWLNIGEAPAVERLSFECLALYHQPYAPERQPVEAIQINARILRKLRCLHYLSIKRNGFDHIFRAIRNYLSGNNQIEEIYFRDFLCEPTLEWLAEISQTARHAVRHLNTVAMDRASLGQVCDRFPNLTSMNISVTSKIEQQNQNLVNYITMAHIVSTRLPNLTKLSLDLCEFLIPQIHTPGRQRNVRELDVDISDRFVMRQDYHHRFLLSTIQSLVYTFPMVTTIRLDVDNVSCRGCCATHQECADKMFHSFGNWAVGARVWVSIRTNKYYARLNDDGTRVLVSPNVKLLTMIGNRH